MHWLGKWVLGLPHFPGSLHPESKPMKTPANPHRRPAFTLVELLVVITILAVLATIGMAVAFSVIQRANRTQALEVCRALVQALESYYDEYGTLPDLPADLTTDRGDGVKLLQILTAGDPNPATTAQSPKQIRFFQTQEAKNRKAGIEWSGDTVKGLWDPWGFPYHIRLDLNYTQKLEDPFASGHIIHGPRALVYTFGKNNRPDGGIRDDVKSW
jgi:prepilin-type N-terminal cleavage/methylation domain-containing protein